MSRISCTAATMLQAQQKIKKNPLSPEKQAHRTGHAKNRYRAAGRFWNGCHGQIIHHEDWPVIAAGWGRLVVANDDIVKGWRRAEPERSRRPCARSLNAVAACSD